MGGPAWSRARWDQTEERLFFGLIRAEARCRQTATANGPRQSVKSQFIDRTGSRYNASVVLTREPGLVVAFIRPVTAIDLHLA